MKPANKPEGSGAEPGGGRLAAAANVYLHYCFDLWAQRWRCRKACGKVIFVRYADDILAGFEHEWEARRFLAEMRERLGQFALSLHPEKTRLIEFGRFAASNRARRGLGKPETFKFLGFIHICDRTPGGAFRLRRKTRPDRMRERLRKIKGALRAQWHRPIAEQGKWLQQVVRRYFAFHPVPFDRFLVKHPRWEPGA